MAQQELRWQIRTEGREGFELGLDTVTPVSFRVTRARGPGKALYALTLPEPITQAYKDWLSAQSGQTDHCIRCGTQGQDTRHAAHAGLNQLKEPFGALFPAPSTGAGHAKERTAMSTNSECQFIEVKTGRWYYILEDYNRTQERLGLARLCHRLRSVPGSGGGPRSSGPKPRQSGRPQHTSACRWAPPNWI